MPIVFKLMPISISCTHCTVVQRCAAKRECQTPQWGRHKYVLTSRKSNKLPRSRFGMNSDARSVSTPHIYESVTAQTFDLTGPSGSDLIPEIATVHVLFYDHIEPQYRN